MPSFVARSVGQFSNPKQQLRGRSDGVPVRPRQTLVATVAIALICVGLTPMAAAQQPPDPNWQTGTQVERKAPALKGAVPGWSTPGNVTVVPRTTPEPKAGPPSGEVTLTAALTDDGGAIEQGLVWRAFQAVPPAPSTGQPTSAVPSKPRLVGSWKEAAPVVKLPPGDYMINASFGRAHLTRKITIAAGAKTKEQFVLNAGGLRVTTLLANGEQIPANAASFDIFAGESDPATAGSRIIGGAKPGLVVRLNAGVYRVVSTYGDANSIVRADVTVDAGKLSEATVSHHAAKVTLKLVTRPGGEAIADTQWTLQSTQGELIRESMGALPSHMLAAGQYVAIAKNSGRSFRRQFTVKAGDPIEVEVTMR